jgi:large conductance mechanosensitive channel
VAEDGLPVVSGTARGRAQSRILSLLGGTTLTGFKNFIMRGDVIILAVGLVIALAFSGLITAFTTYIINPLIARLQGGKALGLGVQLGQAGNAKTFLDFGSFISAIIYFVIFMAVIYFVIVVPYKHIQARRGQVVFGDPAPTKTCPACLSADLPLAATKCKYCATEQPVTTPPAPTPEAPATVLDSASRREGIQ